jgi:hypothetical protein
MLKCEAFFASQQCSIIVRMVYNSSTCARAIVWYMDTSYLLSFLCDGLLCCLWLVCIHDDQRDRGVRENRIFRSIFVFDVCLLMLEDVFFGKSEANLSSLRDSQPSALEKYY